MIEKDNFIKMIESGKNCEQIMQELKCCKNTIKNYLKKYKITTPKNFFKKSQIDLRTIGKPWTETRKKIMSENFSGVNNPFFGKKHSDVTKLKMSQEHADFNGDKNPFKKSLTDPNKVIEHKKRCKNIWDNRNEEYREKFGCKKRKIAFGEISTVFWSRILSNAKTRNINVEIGPQYVWEIFIEQNRKCKLSGIDLIFNHKLTKTTASLDRIDNNIGYIKENVRWVHKKINIMKNKNSDESFIEFCKKVSEYNGTITTNQ